MQENADDYTRFINDQNCLNMLFFFICTLTFINEIA